MFLLNPRQPSQVRYLPVSGTYRTRAEPDVDLNRCWWMNPIFRDEYAPPEAQMIERPAPNADYLDRADVRTVLRSHPVAAHLGARRGPVGYLILLVVATAAAVEAWRLSPWLGVVMALVTLQAAVDWAISWYRVGSHAFRDATESGGDGEPNGRRNGPESAA